MTQDAAEMFVYVVVGLWTLAWLIDKNRRPPEVFTAAAVIALWPFAWMLIFWLWFASSFGRLRKGGKL